MSLESIEEIRDSYLKCIEISESAATLNAEYIYANVKAVDSEGKVFMGDELLPIVKVVEYIEDEVAYEKYLKEKEELGDDPSWAKEYDFGYKGVMIPYLEQSPAYKYADSYYAMIEVSDFKNQFEQPLITEHKLYMVKDEIKGEVY